MKIELKQFRRLHLTCEELCVAAAFLHIPCLYGVSDRWMKRRQGNLYKKVMKITGGLEQKALLLPEISGIVHMDSTLHDVVWGMGHAEYIGRISYASKEAQGKVFLYRQGERIVFMEPDGKGGYHVGLLNTTELEQSFSYETQTDTTKVQEFEKQTADWMGVLLFGRRDCFYETLLDYAWKQDDATTVKETEAQLADCWNNVCQFLCEKHADGGNVG